MCGLITLAFKIFGNNNNNDDELKGNSTFILPDLSFFFKYRVTVSETPSCSLQFETSIEFPFIDRKHKKRVLPPKHSR